MAGRNLYEDNGYGLDINNRMLQKNIETSGAYQAKVSGDYGEYSLAAVMNTLSCDYHIINNVLLQEWMKSIQVRDKMTNKIRRENMIYYNTSGRDTSNLRLVSSTQIDHIVVSKYGLFIIETKNHKGMIFGDDQGKVWTQTILQGGRNVGRFTFYSPVRQNQTHISHLSNRIKLPTVSMRGIIVFTSPDVDLTNVRSSFCTQPSKLLDIINTYNRVIFNDKQVDNIIMRIDKVNNKGYFAEKSHIEFVKKQQKK